MIIHFRVNLDGSYFANGCKLATVLRQEVEGVQFTIMPQKSGLLHLRTDKPFTCRLQGQVGPVNDHAVLVGYNYPLHFGE
jgi:hypothetical protein